jgi:hypothetical protein
MADAAAHAQRAATLLVPGPRALAHHAHVPDLDFAPRVPRDPLHLAAVLERPLLDADGQGKVARRAARDAQRQRRRLRRGQAQRPHRFARQTQAADRGRETRQDGFQEGGF